MICAENTIDWAALAQSWIGTPYVHQASAKGAGCDCLGLIRGMWREVYGQEPEAVPAYTPDWSEPQRDERLWRAASAHLVAKDLADQARGDVILFRMRNGAVAKHLGVKAGSAARPTFIHAYTGHGVVESPFSAPWQRRVVACFEFPKEAL
ncbi:MAG: NlpC/P60 family protein [Paracoccaceae bacterium]